MTQDRNKTAAGKWIVSCANGGIRLTGNRPTTVKTSGILATCRRNRQLTGLRPAEIEVETGRDVGVEHRRREPFVFGVFGHHFRSDRHRRLWQGGDATLHAARSLVSLEYACAAAGKSAHRGR